MAVSRLIEHCLHLNMLRRPWAAVRHGAKVRLVVGAMARTDRKA